MRIFVAVDIDDKTRAQLSGAREAMLSVLATARVPPRVTWVKPESAHVTLRFIGETADTVAEIVKRALSDGFDALPFEMTWRAVGTFPAGRHPRVVWIGTADRPNAITALADEINARLEPLVGAGESRPFKPHITLGRVKEPGVSVDWPRALAAVQWAHTTTRVDHVTLYASRTSPAGAVYTALATMPL